MSLCKLCRVRGRVQGVSYRYATQKKAQELGVTGYARNCVDGSVEVLACGDEKAVERLCQWLSIGPTLAQVTQLKCEACQLEAPAGFTTG